MTPFIAHAEPGSPESATVELVVVLIGLMALGIALVPPVIQRWLRPEAASWKYWLLGFILAGLFLTHAGPVLFFIGVIAFSGRTM